MYIYINFYYYIIFHISMTLLVSSPLLSRLHERGVESTRGLQDLGLRGELKTHV